MPDPPVVTWKPKCPMLPILDDYSGLAPPGYWDLWPKNTPTDIYNRSSWISHAELNALAQELKYPLPLNLAWAVKTLKEGADIGVEGAGRLAFAGKNYATAVAGGKLLCDAMCDWVSKGLVLGPYAPDELPFSDPRISPMSLAPKPNGAGRICVDMSAPHLPSDKVDLNGSTPVAVNAGIDPKRFPSTGVSTLHVLKQFHALGPNCFFSKQDWSDAYKHIMVRPEDLRLQCVSFLGMVFCEGSLTFGASSSPSIFDRISEIQRVLACLKSSMRRSRTLKQLDDVCGFSNWQLVVERFYYAYAEVAERVGIKLADPSDPDKCFSARQAGTILGLEYNSVSWSWSFSRKKAIKIMTLLKLVIENPTVTVGDLKSLAGRLEFYHMVMGPSGKWERGFIIAASSKSEVKTDKVKCTASLISQCQWWARAITVALDHSPIPDPFTWEPMITLALYPDAAGGGNMGIGRGLGVVMEVKGVCYWSFLGHSNIIRENMRTISGDRVGLKMTFLEACAALLGLCSMAPFLKNQPVTVYCDNAGTCYGYEKGYSRCLYAYSALKAIEVVARGINARVFFRKTPRCSGRFERIADHLSRSERAPAFSLMGQDNVYMEPPRTLGKFLMNPVPNRVLGQAILVELSSSMEVLHPEAEHRQELNDYTWKRRVIR